MTMKEALKRIEALEARVRELEGRQMYYPPNGGKPAPVWSGRLLRERVHDG